MPHTKHLDENVVVDLVLGALDPVQDAAARTHIAGCDVCRQLVAEGLRSGPISPPSKAPTKVVIRDGRVVRQSGEPVQAPEAANRLRPHAQSTVASPAKHASPSHQRFIAGATLLDRYRLERVIGEGAAGVVWEAKHTLLQRSFALKFLKVVQPNALKRFLREARVCSMLRHPNIVQAHDAFINPADSTPVLVMDMLTGESLGTRLRRERRLSLQDTSVIISSVVEALRATHALGVVHRDLKPENIFLERASGGQNKVVVLDFGLAKLLPTFETLTESDILTRTGTILGTPYYLAPEQIEAGKSVDGRTDVWALGVILCECLTGRKPFEANGLPSLFKAITNGTHVPLSHESFPPAVVALADNMLQVNPAKRPSLEEVHHVLAG